jgi:RND family efflux transporter MFP subunit
VSQVQPDIDLAGLTRKSPDLPPPRRSLLRILVPLAILLAFGALLASTLGDFLQGSVEVTTIRPRSVEGSSAKSAGTVLFQAAGWIEPDPFPAAVTALTSGVVSEVLVQESQAVRAGEIVAKLVARDAELAVERSQAVLDEARAELARAEAEAKAAQSTWDSALAVQQALAVAQAELRGREAEREHRVQAAASAEARVQVAREEVELQRALAQAGAAGPRQVELAQARVSEAAADLAVLQADAVLARSDAEKARANLHRAERDLELRIDDRKQLDASLAMVALARAKVSSAQSMLEEARLRLARTEVRSASDGIVLERRVMPGSSVGDADAVVCTLYDPHSIRVRVDIPQGEVGKVGVGMRAEILAESRPGRPYSGEVIRLVHKADIQKVTLQVHVRIEDGDALVRPEMLVQARFLGMGGTGAPASGPRESLAIPARLLVEGDRVWVIDGGTRTARLRTVTVGTRSGDEVEITDGINATDKLIDAGREQLVEGARVTTRGE